MKKVLAIVFVLVFAFSFSACNRSFSLEGKWKAPISIVDAAVEDDDNNYILVEFNSDGTGTYTKVNYDRQVAHVFNYEVNGKFLTVTAYSGSLTYECEYSIDGDALTIVTDERTVVHQRYIEK